MPTYERITADGTVSSIEDVILREVSDPIRKTKSVTLRDIERDIASIDKKVQALQEFKVQLETRQALMRSEAEKVILRRKLNGTVQTS